MFELDPAKLAAAKYASTFVESGMVVGLGSGSTASWLVKCLGERVRRENLEFRAVATSKEIAELAESEGLQVTSIEEVLAVDLTIDGADEFDLNLNLIKGGGGALVGEKIVACSSQQIIIIADYTKQVRVLGRFPLPVEIVQFGWKLTRELIRLELSLLGWDDSEVVLRTKGTEPFVTDHGNYIVDLHLSEIEDVYDLEKSLNEVPGIVENGLFLGFADQVICGHTDGVVEIYDGEGPPDTRKIDISSKTPTEQSI
ncbi:MAG: ribose-5-phosphate isomerase RpiA [Aestuariivita sp.]|nr:ribose-5-phosphate isomerase RpiA [Aestuariivita sp.]